MRSPLLCFMVASDAPHSRVVAFSLLRNVSHLPVWESQDACIGKPSPTAPRSLPSPHVYYSSPHSIYTATQHVFRRFLSHTPDAFLCPFTRMSSSISTYTSYDLWQHVFLRTLPPRLLLLHQKHHQPTPISKPSDTADAPTDHCIHAHSLHHTNTAPH